MQMNNRPILENFVHKKISVPDTKLAKGDSGQGWLPGGPDSWSANLRRLGRLVFEYWNRREFSRECMSGVGPHTACEYRQST